MPTKRELYIYILLKTLFPILPLLLAGVIGWFVYSSRTLVVDEIRYDESYNEILPPNEYRGFLSEGFSYSSDSNLFSLNVQKNSDDLFTDFIVSFLDDRIIEQIAVMYVSVSSNGTSNSRVHVFDSFYKPKLGDNKFKIQNKYLKNGTTVMIGFFWKSDFGNKPTPTFEKITYIPSK